MASQVSALDALRAKHAEELEAFEAEAAQLRAGKSGKKKKEVNFEIDRHLADLQYRQHEELEALDGDAETEDDEAAGPSAEEAAAAKKAEEAAAEARRRAKAEKKRAKKASKAREATEKEKRIDDETAALEASSERKSELAAINARLAPERLKVREVAADGHCLYRSVADQLGDGSDFAELRRTCADHMASHRDDFVAFVALDADDPDAAFDDHVRKIRDTAEWGGQPELLALARALRRPIRVHARDAPLLEMGAEFDGAPLVVAYHRHYYALGEHYNSTEAADA